MPVDEEDDVGGGAKLRPLVKWIGSKRRLAPHILKLIPSWTTGGGTYWEPFSGAASVFAALRNAGGAQKAVLGDLNSHMVGLFRMVQQHPDDLTTAMDLYERRYHAGDPSVLYYAEREAWNAGGRIPSRFLFLKQTAFNGLWRVNLKGVMNAAWGKYKTPNLLDAENIMAWHEALKHIELKVGSFNDTCYPEPSDMVYLDPPYVDTFGKYHEDGFGIEAQVMLLKLAAAWSADGVRVAYSNSMAAEPLVDKHWPSATKNFLTTSYIVNRSGEGRKPVQELLVVSKGGIQDDKIT